MKLMFERVSPEAVVKRNGLNRLMSGTRPAATCMLAQALSITLLLSCTLNGVLAAGEPDSYGPVGGHLAPLGAGSGFGSGAISPAGKFQTGVPLDLPAPRGDLPLPLAVVYDGSGQVAEAGVGWSIPFYTVRHSSSLHRRKALFATGEPAERLFLTLGGGSLLMNPTGDPKKYRPFASDTLLELIGPSEGEDQWLMRDAAGREYLFSRINGFSPPAPLWYLTRITDSTRKNKITLKYELDICHASEPDLLIREIEYSFDADGRYGKHRIQLDYRTLKPTAPNAECSVEWPNHMALARVIDDSFVRTKRKIIDQIKVLAQVSEPLLSEAYQPLRTYLFRYAADPDTTLPRLCGVDMIGQGATADVAAPGTTLPRLCGADIIGHRPLVDPAALPVASYEYGSALVADRLTYSTDGIKVHLPWAEQGIASTSSTVNYDLDVTAIPPLVLVNRTLNSTAMLLDFTGDGLPDRVHEQGPQLWLHRNLTIDAGTWRYGDPSAGWFFPAPLSEGLMRQESRQDPDGQGIWLETWRRVLDWNGDGRLDVLIAPVDDGDVWHLYLNVPGSLPWQIEWKKHDIQIGHVRKHLEELGYHFRSKGLPLARARTHKDTEDSYCYLYTWNHEVGDWARSECESEPRKILDGRTVTEWKLMDANGDGHPDFVFNSVPTTVKVIHTNNWLLPECPEKPFFGTPPWEVPTCYGTTNRAIGIWTPTVDRARSNEFRVFHNTSRGPMPSLAERPKPFSPNLVTDPSRQVGIAGYLFCGIETWREGIESQLGEGETWMQCGFVDRNGDGLAEYTLVSYTAAGGVPGYPDPPIPVMKSDRSSVCGPGMLDPWETDPREYDVRLISSLVDVTGDGLPDHVFRYDDGSWAVRVGTGAGFTEPKSIVSATGNFELSLTKERCDGKLSRTVAGLVDFNGDGRPDLVIADMTMGQLEIYRLIGKSGKAGAHDAGLLASVGNGYGGETRIEYGSAKHAPTNDPQTWHQVPFAEIVVTGTTQTAATGLGASVERVSLEPVQYAYGGARLRYHPLLARWYFPGYSRQVVRRGIADRYGGGIVGIALLHDAIGLTSSIGGMDRYALFGRVQDVHVLVGTPSTPLPHDPWALVGRQGDDASRRQHRHTDYRVHPLLATNEPSPETSECYDLDNPYVLVIPTGPDAQLCRRGAIVYSSSTSAKTGNEAPSGEQIRTSTRILRVDALARALLIRYENDVSLPRLQDRRDDDICLSLTYALNPIVSLASPRVLDAVHTARLTDCHDQDVIYSGIRHQYDNLPEGQVGAGLLTRRIIEVYDPSSGAKLDEYVFKEQTNDEFGNAARVTLLRRDGVSQKTVYTYDPFGLVPRQIVISSGGTDLQTRFEYDPLSLLPILIIDPNASEWRTGFDRFGRPVSSTLVTPPDPKEYLLSTAEYEDSPALVAGRTVTETVFHDWVQKDAALLGPAATKSITWFDAFGQVRFVKQPLGDDYGGDMIVTGHVEYDVLGRPKFEAAPYLESESASVRYGTSYDYYPDNRLRCAVRAEGYQPAGPMPTTDESTARFPTCFTYLHKNFQEIIQIEGPNELLPGSPQYGAYDEIRLSAIGWILSTARCQGPTSRTKCEDGRRLELTEFDYNRLGARTVISRSSNPNSPAAPKVTWTFHYDSLGRLVKTQEPATSPVSRIYDEWGNLVESKWLDDSVAPPVVRGTHTTYDGFGRRTSTALMADGAEVPDSIVKYFYDASSGEPSHLEPMNLRGRLSFTTDATLKTFFGYDSFGRQTTVTRVAHADGRPFAEKWRYTPSGELSKLSFHPPDAGIEGERVAYTYDSARRVRNITWTDALGERSLFQARTDQFGRYLEINLGNGVRESYSYRADRRRELLSQTIESATDRRITLYAERDGAGRLKTRSDEIVPAGTSTATLEETVYSYNAANQLARTHITRAGGGVVQHESFAYDALGNLRRIHDFRSPLNSRMLIPDDADPDRLCRSVRGDPPIPPPCTYRYDQLGNVVRIQDTADSARIFTYDAASRLVRMEQGSATTTLRYDALGNPAEIVDGSRLLRRYGPLVEETTTAGERAVERLIPGPLGILASRRGFGPSALSLYQHGDSVANRLFTDDDGAVAQAVRYRPYGSISEETGAVGSSTYTEYLWNGGETFKHFGIVRLGARSYDPATGRFLQRDPLVIPRGARRMHPYAFAFGDPVNLSDPSGRDTYSVSLEGGYNVSTSAGGGGEIIVGAVQTIYGFLSGRREGGPHLVPRLAAVASQIIEEHIWTALPGISRGNALHAPYQNMPNNNPGFDRLVRRGRELRELKTADKLKNMRAGVNKAVKGFGKVKAPYSHLPKKVVLTVPRGTGAETIARAGAPAAADPTIPIEVHTGLPKGPWGIALTIAEPIGGAWSLYEFSGNIERGEWVQALGSGSAGASALFGTSGILMKFASAGSRFLPATGAWLGAASLGWTAGTFVGGHWWDEYLDPATDLLWDIGPPMDQGERAIRATALIAGPFVEFSGNPSLASLLRSLALGD